MSLLSITGSDFVRAVKSGCIKLEHNRDQVDMLNVFPVPDGDTGTNMYLTLLSAVKEGEKHSSESLGKVVKAVSMGSLMGARGNSGVILSQIFRGIAKELESMEQAGAEDLARAFRAGSDTAYKAVMKPVEGTILTVIREVAGACEKEAKDGGDIISTLLTGVKKGYETLEKTPSMLPALKEAGVVDSGGQGLLYFLEGLTDGLAFENDISLDVYKDKVESSNKELIDYEHIELEFQYCTEILIKGENLDEEDIKDHLRPLGDSMMVVGGGDIVKVHIHSNHPGKVLETGLQFGSLSDIKINNMLEEVHEHRQNWDIKDEPVKLIGMVSVGAGKGVIDILKSLGVDEVVEGGQTMNPSTEDLLMACNNVNAREIIILPNNSNVIMSAQQVKHLCEKKVEVIPSKSVMQAVTALIAYDADGEIDKVLEAMMDEINCVSWAEITQAVRDSTYNGVDIKDGDILGLIEGEICFAESDINISIKNVLNKMVNENSELISLLYGEDIDSSTAQALQKKIAEEFPDCEIEMHYGGQPHYSYLIAVE